MHKQEVTKMFIDVVNVGGRSSVINVKKLFVFVKSKSSSTYFLSVKEMNLKDESIFFLCQSCDCSKETLYTVLTSFVSKTALKSNNYYHVFSPYRCKLKSKVYLCFLSKDVFYPELYSCERTQKKRKVTEERAESEKVYYFCFIFFTNTSEN